jgi:hypothetical protein
VPSLFPHLLILPWVQIIAQLASVNTRRAEVCRYYELIKDLQRDCAHIMRVFAAFVRLETVATWGSLVTELSARMIVAVV